MSRRSLVPSIFSLRRASHLSLLHRRWLGNGWLGNQWNGDFNAQIMELWEMYGTYMGNIEYRINMGNLWEIYATYMGNLWIFKAIFDYQRIKQLINWGGSCPTWSSQKRGGFCAVSGIWGGRAVASFRFCLSSDLDARLPPSRSIRQHNLKHLGWEHFAW